MPDGRNRWVTPPPRDRVRLARVVWVPVQLGIGLVLIAAVVTLDATPEVRVRVCVELIEGREWCVGPVSEADPAAETGNASSDSA